MPRDPAQEALSLSAASIRFAVIHMKSLRFAAAVVMGALVLTACRSPQGQTEYLETRRALPGDAEDGAFSVLRAESPDSGELFPAPTDLNVPRHAASLNDTARMLAGLPHASADSYPDVRASAVWRAHRDNLDDLWGDYELRHEQPIRRWAAQHIRDLQGAGALFYPFSGPDFLFANAFFPHAETVVLCGLEPAEPLPQLSSVNDADIQAGMEGLRHALNNVMQFSFFITKDMRSDLQATRFRGVLPVLLVFLARSGHVVESVDTIRLDGAGNPILSNGGPVSGLLIRARAPHGGMKRVFYFRQDLSNDSIRPGAPFLKFVSQLGWPPAFTKSASYLMHEGSFSGIRDYILRNCRGLVQDPSGVPYEELLEQGWDLRLFGAYQGTLAMFSEHHQPDLIAAYQTGRHGAQPLDFGIGYLYRPETSCLMVARPRRL